MKIITQMDIKIRNTTLLIIAYHFNSFKLKSIFDISEASTFCKNWFHFVEIDRISLVDEEKPISEMMVEKFGFRWVGWLN